GAARRGLDGLASTGGAAVPILQRRAAVVVSGNDLLRGGRHLVDRTPSVINALLGMTDGPSGTAPGMPRIRGARGVSARQRRGEGGIGDVAVERAVANRQELAVPAGQRQPDLDLDVGFARRLQRRRDAT